MKLVLIYNNYFLKVLDYHLASNKLDREKLRIIVFNDTFSTFLKKKYNLESIYYDKYFTSGEIENYFRDAILWFHEWSNKKIFKNQSITEYFTIDKCSLWWTSGYLYLCRDIIHLISLQKIIKKILLKEEFDDIILFDVPLTSSISTQLTLTDHLSFYRILKEVLNNYGYQTHVMTIPSSLKFEWKIYSLRKSFETYFFKIFYFSFTEVTRLLLSSRKNTREFSRSFIHSKKPKIVILSPSRNWGTIFNLSSGSKIKGDQKIGYLYQKLSALSSYSVIGVDCNSAHSSDYKIFHDKLNNDPFLHWYSLEYFYDLKNWAKLKIAKKQINKKGVKLFFNDDFQNSFYHDGLNMFPALKNRIKLVLWTFLPFGIVKQGLYDKLFRIYKPNLILVSYETGLHGRAAISAAWRHSIPVLAIQHGRIFSSHPQYIHLKVSTRNKPDPHYAQIADITCLFGDHYFKVLTQASAYPADSLEITGQVSTDVIDSIQKFYNRREFIRDLNFNDRKPLISLMSQNIDPYSDYEKLFQISCKTLSGFPELNFVIKLHPNESINEVKSLIKKYHSFPEKVKILKGVDLYEVLNASDIIITGNSTVGIEAMMFRKPLITIEGFKFSMHYAESKSSIGVISVSQMEDAIGRILNDKVFKKKLINNGQRFIKSRVYKTDGQVSERIIRICDELIKKNYKNLEKSFSHIRAL